MPIGDHAEAKKPGMLRTIINVLVLLAMVLLLSWGLRTFVFQAYEIPSESMEPTIHGNAQVHDMVFSEKITYYTRSPQYKDIVTFTDPELPSRILIKRVIAVGGQTVDLQDGKVVVDGVALDEPYVHGSQSFELPGSSLSFPYTVPEGCLWVMGDNREWSQDSRWFGAIEESSVTGRAVLVYWPVSDIGFLE